MTDDKWISELGIRYQLGVDGLNLFLIALTALAWVPVHALGGLPRARADQALLLQHGAGRDRRARRLHGPGPGAVRRLLRPDAGAVLLPDRRLGVGRPRARHHQVRDLHARRLAADAGGRDRARRAVHARGRRHLVLHRRARAALRRRGHAAVDRAALRAGVLRQGARSSRCTAGSPRPTAPPRSRCWRCYPGSCRRSASTASCGSCCRPCPRAPSTSRSCSSSIAVFSILYGSVLAFSQDNVRLVVAYSSIAQLGFITLGIFSLDDKGAQGAVIQMVNHGLVVVPLFLIIAVVAARAGRQRVAEGAGRHGVPGAGARRAVPDRDLGDAGHARLAQLHRRDPDPVRRLRGQARLRRRGERGRGAGGRVHDPRLPADDAQPRGPRRRVA